MNPKHKKARYFSEQGLFANLLSFKELESRISHLPEKERGDAFEVFAEAYFNTQPIVQASEIWPGNELPQHIRHAMKLPPTDMGIDGVFRTHDGEYHAYQVKYRTNRPSLPWTELATFMALGYKANKLVLFTNSNDLSAVMNDRVDFYSIKGNELDNLSQSDFEAIDSWLTTGQVVRERKVARPHQQEAINVILQELNSSDRATAIMACGTGKTLVALWLAENHGAQTILVLLPSLALVRQTLHDWAKENSWDKFNYLCVCSDVTVAKGEDNIIINQNDLDFSVTSKTEDVAKYLQSTHISRKIIFSTYQSCKVVAEAMPTGFSFDLAIFDEAHKTASRQGANYAFALHDNNLAIKKRVFLTATPRHYNIAKKDKEGDQCLVYSMDDQETYGRMAYQLSFRAAVEKDLICDYKVIISIVTSEMINRELLQKGEIVVEGDVIKAQRIANILAVQNAIEKYNVKRIFSFHSSVKSAQSFTAQGNEGIGAYLKDFVTLHVNGEVSTSKREAILREFEEADKAIISNARCLTEGVNVPVVDMVAFISPKKSPVDIVQAAGRAMRKSPGKKCGYILVPIFMQIAVNESIEDALEKTKFDTVWDVLQALKEQDESLVEIISQMREERLRALGYNDNRLREKIEVLGPELSLNVLRQVITTNIIDRLGSNWNERFRELLKFKEQNGHCDVPRGCKENVPLANWVHKQRQNFNTNNLLQERIIQLNNIGFNWDTRDFAWYAKFELLMKFKKNHNHCNVPDKNKEHLELASWVGNQRQNYKKNKLSKDQIEMLEKEGFEWDPFDSAWKRMFQILLNYKDKHGNCNVPRNHENKQLATWVGTQRANKETLSEERRNILESEGFDWDPINSCWEKMFSLLLIFKSKHCHCNVPRGYENKQLATWVKTQRKNYKMNILTQDKIDQMISVGFHWDPLGSKWAIMFNMLVEFKNKYGHCNVPQAYKKDKALGAWINWQRYNYKKGKLLPEYINKLGNINFCWN